MADNARNLMRLLYRGILRREPDEPGWSQWTAALEAGTSLEDIVAAFLESAESRNATEASLFVPPGHFYSPVTKISEAERAVAAIEAVPWPSTLPGIAIDHATMSANWNALVPYLGRDTFPAEPMAGFRYAYENPSYSWADGGVLHAVIRHYKPKRIIEIGNGWSSACMLDTVDFFLNKECSVTFIDPYQSLLHELVGDSQTNIRLIESDIQDVPLAIFDTLERNDILFIDSTHVLKTGSDVCYELFEILPRLNSGVLVHIHDMFWPFEYPRMWAVNENRAWNELYAVRAFLTNNEQWEIVLFNDYLAKLARQTVEETWPSFLRNSGGALWLRRK